LRSKYGLDARGIAAEVLALFPAPASRSRQPGTSASK